MIFEMIIIFILLFTIVGLVYQFMQDIFLWVMISAALYFLIHISLLLFFIWRKKKKGLETESLTVKNTQTSPPLIPSTAPAEPPAAKAPIPVPQAKPKVDKDLAKLQDFAKKNLKDGFKLVIIKDALLKQGWPKEKVELALSSL